MIFWPPNFGGLWLALNAVLFQAVFVLHLSEVMFSYLIGVGSGEGGCCIFCPLQDPRGLRIGSFLLCFACLLWLPLQASACVGGLVGVFLGLSVGAV